jgi:hypothetical protein
MSYRGLTAALLGLVTTVSLAAATATAADSRPSPGTSAPAEVLKADATSTKYYCQKYYNGYWCTVYVCYCYEDAMDWYNQQSGNARVIAQK